MLVSAENLPSACIFIFLLCRVLWAVVCSPQPITAQGRISRLHCCLISLLCCLCQKLQIYVHTHTAGKREDGLWLNSIKIWHYCTLLQGRAENLNNQKMPFLSSYLLLCSLQLPLLVLSQSCWAENEEPILNVVFANSNRKLLYYAFNAPAVAAVTTWRGKIKETHASFSFTFPELISFYVNQTTHAKSANSH